VNGNGTAQVYLIVQKMICLSIPAKSTAMNGESLKKTVVINNPPHGFHMRPMTKFVQLAQGFQSSVKVTKGNESVDGKSAFEMMLVLAEPGTELTVEVNGPDAREALDALVVVMEAMTEEE
jgi:phosphotransferase system HPr (HPr) family protein